jgi:hypothetical protein
VRGRRDLERAVAASLLCAPLALLAPVEAVALAFAAPLALFLPGYAIAAAAFARRPLGPAMLLVLSLALSLATLALGALLLDYLPGGIRPLPWALLLVAVVLGGCRVAALRRPGGAAVAGRRLPRPGPAEAGLLLGGLALAVAAIALAAIALPAREAVGYTQLWALPEAGGSVVRVGVASEEQDPAAYRLLVAFDGRPALSRELSLRPGEETALDIEAPPAAAGRPVAAVATLTRGDRPREVYRRVKTWLAPAGPPG